MMAVSGVTLRRNIAYTPNPHSTPSAIGTNVTANSRSPLRKKIKNNAARQATDPTTVAIESLRIDRSLCAAMGYAPVSSTSR